MDDAWDVSSAPSSSSRRRAVRFQVPVDGKDLSCGEQFQEEEEEEQQQDLDQEQGHDRFVTARASVVTGLDGLLQVFSVDLNHKPVV